MEESKSPLDQQKQLEINKTSRLNNKLLVGLLAFFIITSALLSLYILNKKTTIVPSMQVQRTGYSQNQNSKNIINTPNTSQPTMVAINQITGTSKNVTNLPLGDYKYTTSSPQKGYIYLCHVMSGGGGAQETGSWIQGNTWNLSLKPNVQGQVSWSQAQFSNEISGTQRIIIGNDLPLNTTTGIFPIQSTDPAYQYDRNPNSIESHNFTLTLPLSPTRLNNPSCMGGEVGVMLNGVPLFNGFDGENRDAAAHEIQDSCDGHPNEQNIYHYHSLSSCIKDISSSTVVGFSLDGYPITGPVLPNGNYLTTNDLDECHGMTSQIVLDGKTTTMYHYVLTEDFPYSASCFRAKPVQMQVIVPKAQNNQPQNINQTNTDNNSAKTPPQAAISACANQTAGNSCSFSTPNGQVTGTCKTPPNQTSMACVPINH